MEALRRLLLIALLAAAGASRLAAAERTLYIALDAVPLREVERAMEDGARPLFQSFQGPVPMISSFPSSTSVAMSGLLAPFGLQRSPGYEARFFDWDEGKVRGGGPVSYFRIRFDWREFFDWRRKGPVRNAVQAVRPVHASLQELDGAVAEFLHSHEPAYFVYVAATDTAAHLVGPDSLQPVFVELDRLLTAAHADPAVTPFSTVVFSDHGIAGGKPLVNVLPSVKRELERLGFEVVSALRDGRSAVLTPYGLVSSFEVYTHESYRKEVAERLARLPGVDLCVRRQGGGWVVDDEKGAATFRRRKGPRGDEWLYEPYASDPLALAPVATELDGGWLEDGALLVATADAVYPDPLHRMARTFDLVDNPASVVCSLEPGYMYGAVTTERAAWLRGGRLQWTHGALYREATLGFVISDDPSWRPPVAARFDSALLPFMHRAADGPRLVVARPQESGSAGGDE